MTKLTADAVMAKPTIQRMKTGHLASKSVKGGNIFQRDVAGEEEKRGRLGERRDRGQVEDRCSFPLR